MPRNPDPAERSLGELVATASKDLSDLVRQEIQLAKVEIKADVAAAGKGAGLLGAAGVLGLYAWLFVAISAAYGLRALGVPLGCAFLLVGGAHAVAAGVLALKGKRSASRVGPPERTVQALKDDVAWAKHPTRSSRETAAD